MANSNYIELAARLNDDLWARRGNNNGGKIYIWENRLNPKQKGVTIIWQHQREDIAVNITTRQMAGAVRRAYKTICERIGLEPQLPKRNNYVFRPAYYEWHLTDGDGRTLLNWVDPAEYFYIYEDEDGNDLEEPRPMTYEQVLAECEDYIECGNMFFREADEQDEREGYHGVRRREWEQLPDNAAEIMAKAIYEYYIAE